MIPREKILNDRIPTPPGFGRNRDLTPTMDLQQTSFLGRMMQRTERDPIGRIESFRGPMTPRSEMGGFEKLVDVDSADRTPVAKIL